jgi:MFS family permease
VNEEAPAADSTCGQRSLRSLVGVLAATAVSVTGTRVSAVALPWFVLVTTGSATRTGLVAFCEMAPYVAVKAFAGPLLDRIGPRTVSRTADAISAAATGLIPLLQALDLLSFQLVLVLVGVIGAGRGPGDLAKEILIPEAADRSRVPLERATGLAGATERGAATVGPAIGGALVALANPLMSLIVTAACFALGSLVIALALPRGMGQAVGGAASDGGKALSYWRRFGEGFVFLRRDPLLWTVIVMISITNLLDAAFMAVLVPVWAKESGNGPAAIGLTGSAWGIAAVGGSLIAAAVAHRLRRRMVFFAGFLLGGAPRFCILAFDVPIWVILAVFVIGGFGSGFLNPILGAILFERIPRPLLGRVGALSGSLSWAGIPLGGLLGGAAVAFFGLLPSLLTSGAAYFLVTSLTGLRPEWREMNRSQSDSAGGQRGEGEASDRPAVPVGRPSQPVASADGGHPPATGARSPTGDLIPEEG